MQLSFNNQFLFFRWNLKIKIKGLKEKYLRIMLAPPRVTQSQGSSRSSTPSSPSSPDLSTPVAENWCYTQVWERFSFTKSTESVSFGLVVVFRHRLRSQWLRSHSLHCYQCFVIKARVILLINRFDNLQLYYS